MKGFILILCLIPCLGWSYEFTFENRMAQDWMDRVFGEESKDYKISYYDRDILVRMRFILWEINDSEKSKEWLDKINKILAEQHSPK